MKKICLLLFLFIFKQHAGFAAGFKIGLAKIDITPELPVWMTGFAARTVPATGVLHALWAKAMVIEDGLGHRMIVVSTDLLGLSHQVSEKAANILFEKNGIQRKEIMFNSSHTHSGPMVWPGLSMIADYSTEDQRKVSAYQRTLTDKLVEVVLEAIKNITPMQLSVGHGQASFAFNRRVITKAGVTSGVNKEGVTDHDVPVIKVTAPNGTVKGILFGYACHNTTIQGDNTLLNGDYAGFTQINLEKRYPDAIAMFIIGCAGDQNPAPRGTVALAQQHGDSLAKAVATIVNGKMKPIKPFIQSAWVTTQLEFQTRSVDDYEKDIETGNTYIQRRAKLVLETYNRGWDIKHYTYPIQAINFGNSFYMIALAGETVVDYSLKLKQQFKGKDLFVAGYSNEVMCYIPSERVLKEGGYEANDNLIYYGMAGPFKTSVEGKVIGGAVQALKAVGVSATTRKIK